MGQGRLCSSQAWPRSVRRANTPHTSRQGKSSGLHHLRGWQLSRSRPEPRLSTDIHGVEVCTTCSGPEHLLRQSLVRMASTTRMIDLTLSSRVEFPILGLSGIPLAVLRAWSRLFANLVRGTSLWVSSCQTHIAEHIAAYIPCLGQVACVVSVWEQ